MAAPPSRTLSFWTILIAACGAIGAAVISSNIDPGPKAWLGVSLFILMALAILAALGADEIVRKVVGQSLFDRKLWDHPDRLELLRAFLSETERVDSAFHGLLDRFRSESESTAPPGRPAPPSISPGLHRGASNAMSRLREAVFQQVREVLPQRYSRRVSTTEMYRAVGALCALVTATGWIVEGLGDDFRRTLGYQPTTSLSSAYERFSQDYAALTEGLRSYLRDNEVLFRRKMEFEPVRLPALGQRS